MVYGCFKDLPRRIASDKALPDKAFDIAKNPESAEYQRGVASIVYKSFNNKSAGGGINNEIMSSQQFADELHKAIIRKLTKTKVYPPFKDNMTYVDICKRP